VDTISSIGHPILDDAATTAFRQWRFHPNKTAWVLRIPIRYVDGPPRQTPLCHVHLSKAMEILSVCSRGTNRPNQSMKPTTPDGFNTSVFAATPAMAYLIFVR
jgi:hypothetical protein